MPDSRAPPGRRARPACADQAREQAAVGDELRELVRAAPAGSPSTPGYAGALATRSPLPLHDLLPERRAAGAVGRLLLPDLEALTNALKHAGATEAEVRLLGHRLLVAVRDDGGGAQESAGTGPAGWPIA